MAVALGFFVLVSLTGFSEVLVAALGFKSFSSLLVVIFWIESVELSWTVEVDSLDVGSGVNVSSIGLISEGSTCVCLEISISPLYIHTFTPIRPYSVCASAIE